MREELQRLRFEAEQALERVSRLDELESFRVAYLGRKGRLTSLVRGLGQIPDDQRPALGKLANEIKGGLEQAFNLRQEQLSGAGKAVADLPDLSLPGRRHPAGACHPVTQIMAEVCAIFVGMGFAVAEGPEVETDFYNFEALNIPPHHPARAMHDTFYFDEGRLLRTHTSPVQIRAMERAQPPLRVISPGKVYRRDSDITHTPMFHQIEGFLVDRQVSFADLKGVLSVFISRVFDDQTPIRFRPSFFPFTEPSVEVDIGCVMCGAKGCQVCKQTGWLEILGAGMIDPEVFAKVSYDPEQYSGFAFGIGIERITMLRYRINDIRLFYENDLRFLRQF